MADVKGLLSDEGSDAAKPVAGLGLLPEPPGPLKAGLESGIAGVKSNLGGAAALVAHGIGAVSPAPVAEVAQGVERAALDYAASQSDLAAQNARQIEEVDWKSPASVANHFKYLLGNALPSLALMFAGGAAGRGFGALAGRGLSAAGKAGALETGMLAGAVAPDVALEAGGIYPEALKTGVEAPAARAALGGAAAASLDFVPLLAAEHYLKAAGKGGFGAIARGAAKGAPVGAALEGSQELLQSVVERASAGQSLTDPDAISDYINSFAGGAAPGLLFGAGIGAHRGMAPKAAPVVAPAPAVAPAAAPATEAAPAVPLTPAQQEQANHAALATAHGQAAAQVDALNTRLEETKVTAAESAKRLDELKTELEKPVGERRPKNEILAERKAINKQVSGAKDMIERIGGELHAAKTSMADIEPKMQAAASKIKTREILAATPTGLNPEIKPKAAPVVSDIIADPNVAAAADRMQTERAVQGVHALFREQGMPLTTTAESLATPPQGARDVALARVAEQTAPKETIRGPNAAQMQAVEPHAMRVVQPLAEIFAEAKTKTPEARSKVTKALVAAMRGVVQEAAKQPTVEAAQAHIEAKLPEALKGHGVQVDAPEIAKEISAAVAQAKTLYSKAAVTGQTVTIVRHGETALNADGKIRGWQDVPLNATGRKQADALGKKLANAGITHILTSDLSRAEDTANEIGKTTGIAVDRFSALRPWNLGTYTGKSAKDAAATLEDHAHNKPDVPVDGGESFNSFKQRFLTGVQAALAAVPGAHVALVTHHRGERLFNAWLAKGMPADHSVDMNVFTNWKDGIEPGTHSTHTVEMPAAPITQTEFDQLSQLGKERVVDTYNRIMAAKGTALLAHMKALVGDDASLQVETFMAVPGGTVGSYTRTGPLKSLITLALNAKDELSVADHEGFHYAEDRLLTAPERAVIRSALQPGKPVFEKLLESVRRYDAANNTKVADEVQASSAEAHAYAFEFWRRGQLQAEGLLAKTFEKIRQVLERIANFIKGQGFTAMEDIFTAMDRGEFAEREQNETGASALLSYPSVAGEAKWYRSALTDAVATLPIKSAPASSWQGQIKGLIAKGAIKQAELDAAGVTDWLEVLRESDDIKVSKEEVMQFIGQHGVHLDETILGSASKQIVRMEELQLRIIKNNEDMANGTSGYLMRDVLMAMETDQADVIFNSLSPREMTLVRDTIQMRNEYASLDNQLQNAELFPRTAGSAMAPKFADYQLPGAKRGSYRELLLTMAERPGGTLDSERFQSTHWEQRDVLAHTRFNERTDVEGKRVLFLEELQSDWAQRLQKDKKAGVPERLTVFSGPFVNKTEAWVALSLKRMIRHAVENGFDRVAWTTGQQQVDRYTSTLRKAVDEIAWKKTPEGVQLQGYKGGAAGEAVITPGLRIAAQRAMERNDNLGFDSQTEAFQAVRENLRDWRSRWDVPNDADARHIADYVVALKDIQSRNNLRTKVIDTTEKESALTDAVGKFMADKIRNDPNQSGTITGENLKIDNTGMAAFYDKIVPNVANDVLKKMGGNRVIEVPVTTEPRNTAFHAAYPEAGIMKQQGFDITSDMVARSMAGIPLFSRAAVEESPQGLGDIMNKLSPQDRILYSRAATMSQEDMARAQMAGEQQQAQAFAAFTKMVDDATEHGKDNLSKTAFGVARTAGSSVSQWWQKNISTPNFIASFSAGYKNVYKTLNTYVRYRNELVERMMIQKIPLWRTASNEDVKVAFAALQKRNVEGYTADSTEWRALNAALTEKQREMAVSATKMFEGFLQAEFVAEQPFYQSKLVTPGEYEKWLARRKDQVAQLIDKGYMPLRRYGDHTVHVYIDATKPDGTPYKLSAGLSFFATAGAAQKASQIYQEEIARSGASMKVEVGTHYKAARDVSISAQQFLDTARRNGVPLDAQEQERLVKALSSADSLTRNRMLQREGMPGYSEDGMRIMTEFGMRMAGKLAYSKFASAIDAATSGRAVDADVIDGQPVIKVDELRGAPGATESAQDFERRNLWKLEGPLSGFHHNLADELTDYVLVPDHTGGWSRKLRGAAMMYFIGGSLSSAAVNVMSVPMMLTPELSVHTPYTNAVTTTMGAWITTWKNLNTLSDIEKLKDPTIVIPGISTELRQALVAAAQYTHDTELHQIMGLSQGALFSQSRNVQRAMKAWMAPFQVSERANRITSFIAAYNVATTGEGVRQADGTFKRLAGTELFNFARDMIDKTQNNYNETNRPGAARNPVFAMLFMFKSFPLFMVEAAKLMYDQNPRAAVNMLLGLTAMTGAQGLPFAETIEDLIDTIAQHIFNSPFNTRRAMRNVLKSATEATVGYDLSDLVLRGGINAIAGVSASSRIGAGDFVPGARLGTADADQGKILESMLGAPYAMIKDLVSNTPAMAAAAATGDWKATFDALRAGGPIAVRNAIKGAEQLNQGYASDSKGRKLIDVSGIDGLMQMTGLSSAALARGYELENINRQTKAFYTQVSADMQQQLVKALKANDTAKVQEIMDMRAAWNKQYPTMPMMNNAQSTRRDLALSGLPMDRRSVLMWGRQIRGENVFTDNPMSAQ